MYLRDKHRRHVFASRFVVWLKLGIDCQNLILYHYNETPSKAPVLDTEYSNVICKISEMFQSFLECRQIAGMRVKYE